MRRNRIVDRNFCLWFIIRAWIYGIWHIRIRSYLFRQSICITYGIQITWTCPIIIFWWYCWICIWLKAILIVKVHTLRIHQCVWLIKDTWCSLGSKIIVFCWLPRFWSSWFIVSVYVRGIVSWLKFYLTILLFFKRTSRNIIRDFCFVVISILIFSSDEWGNIIFFSNFLHCWFVLGSFIRRVVILF